MMMSGFTFRHIGSKQLHRCVNCPVLRIYDFPGGDMIQCIRILFRKIDGEHDGELLAFGDGDGKGNRVCIGIPAYFRNDICDLAAGIIVAAFRGR